MRFCFDSEIRKRALGVCNVPNNQNVPNKLNTSHCMRSKKKKKKFICQCRKKSYNGRLPVQAEAQRLAENVLNRVSILSSNRIQSFFHCAIDFRSVSMVTSFHLFLIASFRSCRLANGSRRPSYTKSCRISQMQYSKGLRSGEYDAHFLKSGVFCCRNCCVTFAWCDGTLSCRNSKSLPDKVDDILVVRKSSTDQYNSCGQLLFSMDQ